MKQIEIGRYAAEPDEIITIDVTAEKHPLLVAFQDPYGTIWDPVSRNALSEKRQFSMPKKPTGEVSFAAASFGEAIQADDPDPTTRYTVTISGSNGGSNTEYIVLGKGEGSRTVIYEFETDYSGPS